MASSSTFTLLRTLEWCKRFTFSRPGAIGTFLEPAITNANTILQTILGAPFAWRWNRVVTGFVTTSGQQDYTLFNWSASTPITANFVTVDSNGNSQSASGGTTGTTLPAFSNTLDGIVVDGSVVWTNRGSINTPVSSTYKFAWIETVSLQAIDANSETPSWKEISPKLVLGLDSALSRPGNISAQGDDGNGNITFRLMPVPNDSYPVAITIQQKPPIFGDADGTGVNQTWAPIPDEYSHIYNWGFLALMLLFSDDPRFQSANQKFVANLLSSSQGLTATERNIFLANWQAITGAPINKEDTTQQGFQGRAAL